MGGKVTAWARSRWAGRVTDERGAGVVVFVVVIVVALWAVAGLVIDGGYALAAKRTADGQAQQAARAGADALSPASLHNDKMRVDPQLAVNAANDYLQKIGANGSCTTAGNSVTCTVTRHQPTAILSAIGINDLPVHATATSRGINAGTP